MKIYDSSVPYITASNLGAVVTLTPNNMLAPVAAKSVASSGPHLTISSATAGLNNLPLNLLTYGGPYGYQSLNVTLSGVVAGDTLTLDGYVYQAVTSGATGTQFVVGGSDAATAANLVVAINNNYATYANWPGPWFTAHALNLIFEGVMTTTVGSGTANVDVEASLDGVNPFSLGISAAPVFAFSGASPQILFSSPVQAGYPLVRVRPKSSFTGTGLKFVVSMSEVRIAK